jgi:hypothetical protein
MSHRRNAPAHIVMTTSFTVPPSCCLTAFTSPSGKDPNANRRCGVITPLNGVRGAFAPGDDNSSRGRRTDGTGTEKFRAIAPRRGTVRRASRSPTRGWETKPRKPRPSIDHCEGSVSGRHGSSGAGTGGGSGVRSSRTPRISAPETPSMQA